MPIVKLHIRFLTAADYHTWVDVYSGYIAFCRKSYDQHKIDTLWHWIMTGQIIGLVACTENNIVGVLHAKELLSPLNAHVVGYLDDLYIVPEYRGKQIAQALIIHLKELARKRSWLFIRWITRENNYRAKAFYDKIARKTHWHTYQIDI